MNDAEDPIIRRAQERVGSVLNDKWTLHALLGVGGMAAVYSATHRNKKRGAVKLLHPELSHEPSIRERFLREGYVANTVDHPGAVRVDDDDVTEDGSAFLVMELLEGETLEARAERKGGCLPEEEVAGVADQLLDVLSAAHEKGVVHRDLKPENLFLTRGGVLKVLDFGIARLRESNTKSTATQTGSTMGTPAFMAPEQARGRWEEVDARTDLWAVGASMFTLLSGRLVFPAETSNEMLAMAMIHHAPPLLSVAPGVSPGLAAVVDQALAYDKAARYQSAAEMQQALRAAVSVDAARLPAMSIPDAPRAVVSAPGAQTVAVWSEPGSAVTKQPASKSLLVAGIGAVGVAVLGLVAVLVVRGPGVEAESPAVTDNVPASSPVASAPAPTGPEVTPEADPTVSLDELPPVGSAESAGKAAAGGTTAPPPPVAAPTSPKTALPKPFPQGSAPRAAPPVGPKLPKPPPDPFARRR